jgi:hypothetical protein
VQEKSQMKLHVQINVICMYHLVSIIPSCFSFSKQKGLMLFAVLGTS